MGKQKDMLWKGVLDQMFEDFLPFLNPDLTMSLDLQRGFEFMDKELNHEFPSVNGAHEQKIVDKLIKLYTKEGKPVLLHLEVQDKYIKDFIQRMYTYFNRLYDKYKMPIIAYAIFTEPNEIKRADTFELHGDKSKL